MVFIARLISDLVRKLKASVCVPVDVPAMVKIDQTQMELGHSLPQACLPTAPTNMAHDDNLGSMIAHCVRVTRDDSASWSAERP